MPRRKSLKLPEDFSKAYPELLQPIRIATNRLAHPSPLKDYPGEVITPMSLTADDFNTWWEAAGKGQPEDDHRHWSLFEWETRFHLIKTWKLKNAEGVDLGTEVIQADPIKMPDMRLVIWITTITQPILSFSVSLPNLQGPLNAMQTI